MIDNSLEGEDEVVIAEVDRENLSRQLRRLKNVGKTSGWNSLITTSFFRSSIASQRVGLDRYTSRFPPNGEGTPTEILVSYSIVAAVKRE